MSLSGCAVYTPAGTERLHGAVMPESIPGSAWPARSSTRLEAALESLPEELTATVPQKELAGGTVTTKGSERRLLRLSDAGVYGNGLVFRVEPATPIAERSNRTTTSLKFLTYPLTSAERRALREGKSPTETASATGGERRPTNLMMRRGDPWRFINRGLWLRLDEPKNPRGLIVQLTSYGGAKYEQPVIDEFIERGWAVLRVNSPNLRRDSGPPPIKINSQADFEPVARYLAELIDNRLAEHAYAVESALAFIAEHRPDIPQHPLVVVGFSAGALVTPAVAARLENRIDAAVLVCGGANLLDISQRSDLTNAGITLDWAKGLGTPADFARLKGLYLAHSRLDPYNAAAYLTRTPVLQLHGSFDGIVPADDGDTLYERLHRPERLVYPMGHLGVFWLLPTQADRIANWIDRTVAPTSRGRVSGR